MKTWTWRCLPCWKGIEAVFGTPPSCDCVDPYFVSMSHGPREPLEAVGPNVNGDAEDQALYLMHVYGGRYIGAADPRYPERGIRVACWRPPRDGEKRVPWQEAYKEAYADMRRENETGNPG